MVASYSTASETWTGASGYRRYSRLSAAASVINGPVSVTISLARSASSTKRRPRGQALDQPDTRRIAVTGKARQRQAVLMQLHQQISKRDRLAQTIAALPPANFAPTVSFDRFDLCWTVTFERHGAILPWADIWRAVRFKRLISARISGAGGHDGRHDCVSFFHAKEVDTRKQIRYFSHDGI